MDRGRRRLAAAGAVVLLGVVAVAGVGLRSGDDLRAADVLAYELRLTTGGTERTALVHLPAARRPLPLLVALHGAGGTGAAMERDSGFSALADRHRFAVVYPDGRFGTWNAGGCCLRSAAEDVPDEAFIQALVQRLVDDGRTEPDRVFLTGFSNGGMMALRLACVARVRGVAVVGAAMVSPCQRTTATRALFLHGSADRLVPIAGYRGETGDGMPLVYPPFATMVERWRLLLGCGPAAASCPPGHRVEAVQIDGMGHAWPGNLAFPAPDDRGVKASDRIVKFLGLTR